MELTSEHWDLRIVAALIALFGAFFGILVKEVVIRIFFEKRESQKEANRIYKAYADPIEIAAKNLFWRLNEIVIDSGRTDFFMNMPNATKFEKYKFESTLYRIAALLGWLRAHQREIARFSLGSEVHTKNINKAIDAFSTALSDGSHIEIQRMENLADLWSVELPSNIDEQKSLAASIDGILQRHLHMAGALSASGLPDEKKSELLIDVANCISKTTSEEPPITSIIEETKSRAIQYLSVKEAWLYRDFQSAIGDIMIFETDWGIRRFDVIGFRDFEKFLDSKDPFDKNWHQRLSSLIDGLDTSKMKKYDARIQMLEDTLISVVALLISINDPRNDRQIPKEISLGVAAIFEKNWQYRFPFQVNWSKYS